MLRLLVHSANFVLEYANTSTSLHNDLKAMATKQVGFLRNNFDVEVFLSVTQATCEEQNRKPPNVRRACTFWLLGEMF